MTKVVLDEVLLAKLNGGRKGLEFTDEKGNVVGHYITDEAWCRIFELIQPPLTKEERAEARREMREGGEGVSTAEILAAIESAKREWMARQ